MARQQGPLNDVATSSNGIRSQASERRFKNSCELPWQHNHLQQAHTEYADIIPVEQEVESSTSIYFISYLMFLLFYTLKNLQAKSKRKSPTGHGTIQGDSQAAQVELQHFPLKMCLQPPTKRCKRGRCAFCWKDSNKRLLEM